MFSWKSLTVGAIAVVVMAVLMGYRPLPECMSGLPYKAHLALYSKILCDLFAPVLERYGWITSLELARAHSQFFTKRGADTKSLQSFDTFFDFIPVRIYKPTSMKSDSALFYIHGGGWVLDNLDTYDQLVRYMAQELEIFVVSVDYRLAPEMRYPAAINDVERAFRYFYEHAGTMGINSSRIAVAGDSAGGNLAAALTLRLRNRAVQPNGRIDSKEPSAKLQILLYPTLQAFNFSTVSMLMHKDDQLLSRNEMLRFVLQYALGMEFQNSAILRRQATRYLEEGCYRASANNRVQSVFVHRNGSDIRERILSQDDLTFLASLQNNGATRTCSIKDPKLTELHERLECLLDPEFSPLLARSLEHLPAAFILSCSQDVLRDDALLYAERLRQAAVAVEQVQFSDLCHGFLLSDASRVVLHLRRFLQSQAL